jgi:hypothetical protein
VTGSRTAPVISRAGLAGRTGGQVLAPLVDTYMPGLSVDALSHVTLGGLYGAALYIARSPEPEAARAEADLVLDTLIFALRSGAASRATRPPSAP